MLSRDLMQDAYYTSVMMEALQGHYQYHSRFCSIIWVYEPGYTAVDAYRYVLSNSSKHVTSSSPEQQMQCRQDGSMSCEVSCENLSTTFMGGYSLEHVLKISYSS